jgi:hypothetical protein
MIEKKIKYEVNIEKPSKTKPVKQGGVLNYLGKQKTVNAPRHWRSSPKHPIAHLSYITKDEEKILIDLNLYGSLKGKPNRGPFGLPSLQGSGGGSGGDGGGDGGSSGGDSGPGGSDDGTGGGGPGPGAGPGDSGPGGSDDGTGHGGPGPGDAGPGPGPGDTFGSSTADDAAANQAASEAAAQAASDAATIGMQQNPATEETGVMSTVTNAVKNAIQNAINNPVQTAIGFARGPLAAAAFGLAKDAYSNYARGVTAPDDFSQSTTSVQSNTQSPSNDGGINTLQAYAPLYNSSETTGDSTMDAYIRRLRINLGLPV